MLFLKIKIETSLFIHLASSFFLERKNCNETKIRNHSSTVHYLNRVEKEKNLVAIGCHIFCFLRYKDFKSIIASENCFSYLTSTLLQLDILTQVLFNTRNNKILKQKNIIVSKKDLYNSILNEKYKLFWVERNCIND